MVSLNSTVKTTLVYVLISARHISLVYKYIVSTLNRVYFYYINRVLSKYTYIKYISVYFFAWGAIFSFNHSNEICL